MIDAWTGDSDQANIPVVEQLPLLDSENSLAEQMAEAAAATATIQALQLRWSTRIPTSDASVWLPLIRRSWRKEIAKKVTLPRYSPPVQKRPERRLASEWSAPVCEIPNGRP
jgi:hypothetical protein